MGDIAIWATYGLMSEMEIYLQQAPDIVSEYARKCGLACLQQRSELLIVSPRKTLSPGSPTISPEVDSHRIVPTQKEGILDMLLEAGSSNTKLLDRLKQP